LVLVFAVSTIVSGQDCPNNELLGQPIVKQIGLRMD
jgi:hypothetical protein